MLLSINLTVFNRRFDRKTDQSLCAVQINRMYSFRSYTFWAFSSGFKIYNIIFRPKGRIYYY